MGMRRCCTEMTQENQQIRFWMQTTFEGLSQAFISICVEEEPQS